MYLYSKSSLILSRFFICKIQVIIYNSFQFLDPSNIISIIFSSSLRLLILTDSKILGRESINDFLSPVITGFLSPPPRLKDLIYLGIQYSIK